MNVSFDRRAYKLLDDLPEKDKGKVSGNIRVLFGLIDSDAIIVNISKKKTQKTPIKEIETAKRRLREYQL